jgi:hypothetical protein
MLAQRWRAVGAFTQGAGINGHTTRGAVLMYRHPQLAVDLAHAHDADLRRAADRPTMAPRRGGRPRMLGRIRQSAAQVAARPRATYPLT